MKERKKCRRGGRRRPRLHDSPSQLWMKIIMATTFIQFSAYLLPCLAFVPDFKSHNHHNIICHGSHDKDPSVAATNIFQRKAHDVQPEKCNRYEWFSNKNLMTKFLLTTILTVFTPLDLPFVTTTHKGGAVQQQINIQRISAAWAMTEQQFLVNDVWKEVTQQYVDPTYNGLGEEGWKKARLKALKRVEEYGPDDNDKVYAEIRSMLQRLGDPYTRFLTPEQYESLTTTALGTTAKSGGIGVQLLLNSQGQIVIANLFPKGPAERAGIQPGDILVTVDDVNFLGDAVTPELAAAKLRGALGTSVTISVQRQDDHSQIMNQQQLIREALTMDPVQFSTFVSSSSSNNNEKQVGVLKVSTFSQETVSQVQKALHRLPYDILVIDLRGNVGGYMPAGVNMAKLFLQPRQRVISEVDKTQRKTIYINDGSMGGANLQIPIYILVDQKTASASEIFVAALQDNDRATVVGSTRTFGKGRIQNVQLLEGGSGIAVTKAKYMTPKGNDLHGIGILPDRTPTGSCQPSDSAASCLSGMIL